MLLPLKIFLERPYFPRRCSKYTPNCVHEWLPSIGISQEVCNAICITIQSLLPFYFFLRINSTLCYLLDPFLLLENGSKLDESNLILCPICSTQTRQSSPLSLVYISFYKL